ncbi:MAG: sensor histidine kinase [Gaiellaceae bacterium]
MASDFEHLSQDRLRALVGAGIELNSELSLEGVLARVVESAALLTGARHARLEVAALSNDDRERTVSYGISDSDSSLPQFIPSAPGNLSAPILIRGEVFGNLRLGNKRSGQLFSAEDEGLLRALVDQAAVAIENARLYEAQAWWTAQLESLNEIGNALVREPDLSRLLELICQRLRELLGARLVAIGVPAGEDELRFAAADGEGREGVLELRVSRRRSKLGQALERRQSERVDASDDSELDATIAEQIGIRAGLWVPLLVRERAIGVILVVDRLDFGPHFTDEDLRLAEVFAARAAVAVEMSERVARDSLRRVVAAQELERRRLSRELHDETGQTLTSVLLGLKAIEQAPESEQAQAEVERLHELVTQALQDVRRLAVELRPKALDDFGLLPALKRLGSGFSEQTGIRVEVESFLGEERLPSEIETALYRIVQESLTNVVKHARAGSVSVLVTRKSGSVIAVIEDDGRGFDAGAGRDEGLGLVGMEERVALLDGRLQIESSEGAGTTIVAEVPLR